MMISLAVEPKVEQLLAVLDMPTGAATEHWRLAALHGIAGLGGLGCLALALGGPVRGVEQGTALFGMISAWLLAAAALLGVSLLAARLRKRRLPGFQIGMHATLAVSGFVVLAAYFLS